VTATRKGRSLLERAGEEASLLNEFWLIAVSDAFQRHLMARVVGRPASEVLDLYFTEHPHMKQFYDRHVDAGTCDVAIAELRSDREKSLPSQPLASPPNPDFGWANCFRAPPSEIAPRTTPGPAPAQDPISRPRGPRPAKFLFVLTAMQKHDRNDLVRMTEETMRATFGASRDVCRKARAAVQSGVALSDK
jgi:hypothetical protein